MDRHYDCLGVGVNRWIILRTSGGQTLPLMRSLIEAGFNAWTPAKTFRKTIRANTLMGSRQIEQEAPILPTFVFAPEADVDALLDLAMQSISPHPAFSLFRYVDRNGARRAPFISEQSIAGLRKEEADRAADIKAIHDAESYAEAEALRIAAIQSASLRRRAERARERAEKARELEARNALFAQRGPIEPGKRVQVVGAPAFVGASGVFEEVDGPYARVRFGSHSWKIEGWRVLPASDDDQASQGLAA